MDRVVCGDVGFGKTEVAMRAAFVAVQAGKTGGGAGATTLLAEQHYRNFRDRFADWPVRIEVAVALPLAEGDRRPTSSAAGRRHGRHLVGTHRLLQAMTCASRTSAWSSSTRSSASACATRSA
jgi:transcription-repair coupling factor (superfamily II helicase)